MILKNAGIATVDHLKAIKKILAANGEFDVSASDIFLRVTKKDSGETYLTAAFLGGRSWHIRAAEGFYQQYLQN